MSKWMLNFYKEEYRKYNIYKQKNKLLLLHQYLLTHCIKIFKGEFLSLNRIPFLVYTL